MSHGMFCLLILILQNSLKLLYMIAIKKLHADTTQQELARTPLKVCVYYCFVSTVTALTNNVFKQFQNS